MLPTPKTELTAERIASERAFTVGRYEDWAKSSAKPMIDSTGNEVMLAPSGMRGCILGSKSRACGMFPQELT